MSATTTIPDVPIPAGVTNTDAWQEDTPQPYRVLFGELRNTGGVKFTTVQATAVQFADGRIDDGSEYEAPHVYLGDDALTSAQARDLAAALIETADEVDWWAEQHQGSEPLDLQNRKSARHPACVAGLRPAEWCTSRT